MPSLLSLFTSYLAQDGGIRVIILIKWQLVSKIVTQLLPSLLDAGPGIRIAIIASITLYFINQSIHKPAETQGEGKYTLTLNSRSCKEFAAIFNLP